MGAEGTQSFRARNQNVAASSSSSLMSKSWSASIRVLPRPSARNELYEPNHSRALPIHRTRLIVIVKKYIWILPVKGKALDRKDDHLSLIVIYISRCNTDVLRRVTGEKRHLQLQSRGDAVVAIFPLRQAICDMRKNWPDRPIDYANQSLAMRPSNDPLIVRLSFELDTGTLTGLSVLGSTTPVLQKVSRPWIWR